MDRVRRRVTDKRVLALVKAFLKAGVLVETGVVEDSVTGTPQGGILSPLLANIALSALDDHFAEQWTGFGGRVGRAKRRRHGRGTWRLVRYADDFVVMVHGTRGHAEALRHEVAAVLAPLGLRLSPAKTQVVHLTEGFEFLGFRIIRKRKRGTSQWYVYTFIADKPVRALKRKIRSLTHRLSQANHGTVLTRINRIQHGWANYFKHAVAKHTFSTLQTFVWWRVIKWVMHRNRMRWTAVKRWLKGPRGWRPITLDEVELFNIASVTVSRYRWRGTRIPAPWPTSITEPSA